jgi:hypothetical protein
MKPRRIAIGQAAGSTKVAKSKSVEHVRAA